MRKHKKDVINNIGKSRYFEAIIGGWIIADMIILKLLWFNKCMRMFACEEFKFISVTSVLLLLITIGVFIFHIVETNARTPRS